MRTEEKIRNLCKELRLGKNIYENYRKIREDSNEDYLVRLLELEVEHRKIVRKNRNLKNAGFGVIKTFEDYEFENIQIPESISLSELKSASMIEKKENLILFGPVGTGKTHLASAIGFEACSRGKKVKFYTTAGLVNRLIEAKKEGELERFMKRISKIDLLICDEWGYIPFEKEGSQLLFQVISECYERKSVIITTNLEFGKWNGIFYDEKLTSALIDRLIHHSHLLVFSGASYRLKNSKMRTD